MMPQVRSFNLLAYLVACGIWAMPVAGASDERHEQLFVRRVAPIFQQKCLPCHGADKTQIKGELNLSTKEAALQGGESGQSSIISGDPESSPLYLAILRSHDEWPPMPPKEADQLSEQQVEWIREWILAGAVWPDQARAKQLQNANAEAWDAEDGVTIQTSGGLSPDWTGRRYKPEDLWAYRPVQKPEIPRDDVHPIDFLINARMPAELPPAPAADRKTLLRRATFDLTGLPPTPEEVAAFLSDRASDDEAFAAVVERLLASPHYGERMAQHWLDVTRYADSSGFANDYERGSAWRYRDYVVRSFNDDKRYSDFVREQIAGDEVDPDNPEMLIATGFLRMGPWELTGMEVAKVARQRFLDDVTNSVGETFLGQSLQCARCHDHKFDPVPTQDFYAIQAVFATTQLAERPAPFLPEENCSGFEEREYLEQRRAEYQATLARLDTQLLDAAELWFHDQRIDPKLWNSIIEQLTAHNVKQQPSLNARRDYQDTFNAARSALMKAGVPENQFPPKALGFSAEDYGNERVARKGLERLRWEFDRYEPVAFSVYNGRTPTVTSVVAPIRLPKNPESDGELETTCVLTGGDPFSPGQPVEPGVLSVLSAIQTYEIPSTIAGRRSAFANWVANEQNPLTMRVIANRIWQWHFGKPIAGNPNNFGSTGAKPANPELLDWLSATFAEQKQSFKSMHRLIMSSRAYRRSHQHPDHNKLMRLDAPGATYAVFPSRRLSAEELRDAMLVASGELNTTVGGIPNRPEMNLEAALQPRQVMGTFASAWIPNPLPAQRNRRSLYALKLRGLPDPMQEVFNSPTPDFSCERRESSTVTPQAFCLFNGRTTHTRALALAHRALRESSSDEQAIERCFLLALSRSPEPEELEMCRKHWQSVESTLHNPGPGSTTPPLMIQREAIEENTGEKFSFAETLHSNASFVADLQPTDVSVHTQALADVCLVLFNSNEFAYVD